MFIIKPVFFEITLLRSFYFKCTLAWPPRGILLTFPSPPLSLGGTKVALRCQRVLPPLQLPLSMQKTQKTSATFEISSVIFRESSCNDSTLCCDVKLLKKCPPSAHDIETLFSDL